MFQFNSIIMKHTISAAFGLALTATSLSAVADRDLANNLVNKPRGLLDQQTTVEAPGRVQAISPAERAQARRELRRQARVERRELRRLNENQLRREARAANRLAQLVLAESLADEAQRFADVPALANDALGEALQWYSLAARRGYPGSVAIDTVLPSFPVKVFRN